MPRQERTERSMIWPSQARTPRRSESCSFLSRSRSSRFCRFWLSTCSCRRSIADDACSARSSARTSSRALSLLFDDVETAAKEPEKKPPRLLFSAALAFDSWPPRPHFALSKASSSSARCCNCSSEACVAKERSWLRFSSARDRSKARRSSRRDVSRLLRSASIDAARAWLCESSVRTSVTCVSSAATSSSRAFFISSVSCAVSVACASSSSSRATAWAFSNSSSRRRSCAAESACASARALFFSS
mmetsp:Transcript_14418/g.43681  ORF Transcript_14418/g.43681 Transcript_14418/m.43681 type:complete len:246 (+) Transcript_14418:130-867(+)